ncbi:MAG: HlyD family efflux transporter periplasmic adaptor subunit, partial [Victivallales bacterium]|nr:HlyD family efflux transporter periplasmic adaptor subunit [Victivallales bacterium]
MPPRKTFATFVALLCVPALFGAEYHVFANKPDAPFQTIGQATSRLQPGDVCATVIQLDPIKLVAFVPETEVSRISVGAMGRARLATGGADITGKVTFLSRASDPTTRTFRVEMEVPNSDL